MFETTNQYRCGKPMISKENDLLSWSNGGFSTSMAYRRPCTNVQGTHWIPLGSFELSHVWTQPFESCCVEPATDRATGPGKWQSLDQQMIRWESHGIQSMTANPWSKFVGTHPRAKIKKSCFWAMESEIWLLGHGIAPSRWEKCQTKSLQVDPIASGPFFCCLLHRPYDLTIHHLHISGKHAHALIFYPDVFSHL